MKLKENAEFLKEYFNGKLELAFNVTIERVEIEGPIGVFRLKHVSGDFEEVSHSVRRSDDGTKIALAKKLSFTASRLSISGFNSTLD